MRVTPIDSCGHPAGLRVESNPLGGGLQSRLLHQPIWATGVNYLEGTEMPRFCDAPGCNNTASTWTCNICDHNTTQCDYHNPSIYFDISFKSHKFHDREIEEVHFALQGYFHSLQKEFAYGKSNNVFEAAMGENDNYSPYSDWRSTETGTYRHFYEYVLPKMRFPENLRGRVCKKCSSEYRENLMRKVETGVLSVIRAAQRDKLICGFDETCLYDADHECAKCGKHCCVGHITRCSDCNKTFCVERKVYVESSFTIGGYVRSDGGCLKNHKCGLSDHPFLMLFVFALGGIGAFFTLIMLLWATPEICSGMKNGADKYCYFVINHLRIR